MNEVHMRLQSFWHAVCLQIAKAAPKVLVGVIILIVAGLIAIIVKYCIIRLGRRSKKHPYLYRLIGSTVKIVIFIIGLIVALGTMGINVTALVASLGLAGFAVGFALKDTLSNLLAGFMVLFYQPFRAGDYIVVGKVEGKVIDINLRYTVVKTDSEQTYVPNSTILSSPVTVKD